MRARRARHRRNGWCKECKRPRWHGHQFCKWHFAISVACEKRNRPAKGLAIKSLTYRGSTKSVSAWARKYQLNNSTLRKRLDAGWSVAAALTTPARVYRISTGPTSRSDG